MEEQNKKEISQQDKTVPGGGAQKPLVLKWIAVFAAGALFTLAVGTAGVIAGWHLGLLNAPTRAVFTERTQQGYLQQTGQETPQSARQPQQTVREPREERNARENTAPQSGDNAQTQTPPAQTQTPAQTPQAQTQNYIDVEEAKLTALSYANLTDPAEAFFTKARLDREDGRVVYEIEYFAGTTEYDIDVDAVTGVVVDVDIDYNEWFD